MKITCPYCGTSDKVEEVCNDCAEVCDDKVNIFVRYVCDRCEIYFTCVETYALGEHIDTHIEIYGS